MQTLQPFFDEAPASWSVALAVVTLAGAILWIAGGRLARAGVAIGGFFLGGVLAASAAAFAPGGGWSVGIGVGGALAGTLLAFLLYRLWVGLLAGAILAAVVPAALLLWGVQPPAAPGEEAPAAALAEPSAPANSLFGVFDGERGEADGGGVDEAVREVADERLQQITEQATAAFGDFFEAAAAAWKAQLDAARSAWANLSEGSQRTAIVGGVGGFLVGLLLGLAVPNVTAAVQTSLVGSVLLCGGALLLLQKHAGLLRGAPADGSTEAAAAGGLDPRALLLAIGLVTLVGLLVQWTLGRRRADA